MNSIADNDEYDDEEFDIDERDEEELDDDDEEDLETGDAEDNVESELDEDEWLDDEDEQDEDDEEDDDEEDDDNDAGEFTLDHLSAAYAGVLKQRGETEPDSADDSEAVEEQPVEPETEPAAEPAATKPTLEEIAREEEESDLAASPVSPESILEAILFVGGPKEVKLNSRKIAALMRNVSPKEVTSLAKQLNKKYEQENAAYRIVSEKGSLRMVLAPSMAHVQHRIRGGERAKQLSQQAIDVLAVVAYNQPIDRERVEKIRGYSSGAVINQLVRRNLLDIHSVENRKRQFCTTDRFLDLFGLESLEDLPQTHDVSDLEELAD